MTDVELAWLAGLFDGEGCVSINKVTAKNYKRPGFQLRASISITNEHISDLFQKSFGGTHKKVSRVNARTYWQWVIVARQAKSCLLQLEPFLKIKGPVARVGIDFQEYRENNYKSSKTDEYWNKEFECYESVRKLNARWGTEYYVA